MQLFDSAYLSSPVHFFVFPGLILQFSLSMSYFFFLFLQAAADDLIAELEEYITESFVRIRGFFLDSLKTNYEKLCDTGNYDTK